MSQENVEIVRRVYEAYDRQDLEACFAEYAADIEWRNGGPLGELFGPGLVERSYFGHDGIRQFWREWLDAWETVDFDWQELIDAGDQVVAIQSQRVRGRASGVELEMKSYAQVWTVRDGKLVRSEFFPTREEALEAVGLSE
jgi:ketosteroid isomerase-like protein